MNVIIVPTKKHDRLKTQALGIYNAFMVESIAEILAAIIVEVNANA